METKRYRTPPLTERAISIGFGMPEEPFRQRLDTWNEVMRHAFPDSETVTRWDIQVAEKHGMPYIPRDKQRLTTKHQFWQRKGDKRDRCIQVWADRVAFNLLSPPGDPRTYEDLLALYSEWCPKWASHFEVKTVSGVTLEYVNILSSATVPKFCHGNRMNIGEILTTYGTPGPLKDLIPPFKFQLNFDADGKDFPMKVSVELAHVRQEEIALRLLFKASSEETGREVPLDALPREIDTAHRLILAEFDAFFTEKAKLSFEPT
jgi:hypothetical protein